jgi:uncharacterized MAPEG superfamily protein
MSDMIHVVGPIAAAGAMPYLLTLASKARAFTAEDNKQTRLWQGQLEGWRRRAFWAHQNSFEVFPLFAAFTILAYLAQPESVIAMATAWVFVALRLGYAACYLADLGAARSAVWFLAMFANVVLLLVALRVI